MHARTRARTEGVVTPVTVVTAGPLHGWRIEGDTDPEECTSESNSVFGASLIQRICLNRVESEMEKQKRSRKADLLGESNPPRRSHNGGKGDGGRSANPYRDALYQEQARVARLKADQLSGKLVLAADVEKQWTARIVETRQRLLAVPSRIGAKHGLSKAQIAAIDAEIRATLTALAGQEGDSDVGRTPRA